MVTVEHVRKRFGAHEVLSDVSLQVGAGDVTCVIGRSGCGKTTLLRCINHLEPINAGWIWVDGSLVGYREVDGRLYELNDRQVARQRRNIGMVFQQFNLFSHKTALENVIEGPVHVAGVPRDAAISAGQALLRRVGLEKQAHYYPAQLSGGQQQRVGIARALAMQPKLMLFDEPTSSLDPELVSEVLDVIRGLAADGMTMIIATHEMKFVRDVADTVVFMDGGRISEEGTPEEVLDRSDNASLTAFLSRQAGN